VRRLRTVAVTTAVGVAALIGAPGLAVAQNTGIQAAKLTCDNAVATRELALGHLLTDADAAPNVDAAAKKSLDLEIQVTVDGLRTLKGTIDAATLLADVRKDCRRIVTDYYTFGFLVPQVRLVIASDRVTATAATLKHLQALLQSRVDAARARNLDITSAQGFVTDLGVKVDAATKASSGVPPAVLPLKATGFPGNRPTIVTARASLDTARGALQGAVAAATSAMTAIKALR